MKRLLVFFYIVALLMSPLNEAGVEASGQTPQKPAPAATAVTTAGTAYLTIPASAFTPHEDGYDFQNDGRYLKHFDGPSGGNGRGWYLAPVNLPNGAVVTKMTFYYRDNSTADGVARLQRTNLAGGYENMASVDTSGGWSAPWYKSKSTTAIGHAQIDNSRYAYWVVWDLPYSSKPPSVLDIIWGCSVVIEYVPPAPTTRGVLSIPAAAFKPYEDGYDFQNDGRYLEHLGVGPSGWYMAAVNLPNGAVVTKMTFYYYSGTTGQGVARLQRTDLMGGYDNMASVESLGTGYASDFTNTISYPHIDNFNHSYWVVWELMEAIGAWPFSAGPVNGCGVVIEYEYPTSGTYAHNYSTIPAAAFAPYEDGYDFQNDGRYLRHFHDPNGGDSSGWYLAPVNLPDGVAVTDMFIDYKNDTNSSGGIVKLQRSDMQGHYEDMASLTTPGSTEWRWRGVYDIHASLIDNAHYSYWLVWVLPKGVYASGVNIGYRRYRTYLPTITNRK
jgi:hypothetical protein